MARSRFLIAYDVADDKRRAAAFKLLHDYGDRLQFSVFVCDLTDREAIDLRRRLAEGIHHQEDSVVIVGLGPSVNDIGESLDTLGKPLTTKEKSIVI